MAIRYEFYYETPQPGVDSDGNPLPNIPTTFGLPGTIDLNVAKGIRFGLRRVQQLGGIVNVTVATVDEARTAVTTDPT